MTVVPVSDRDERGVPLDWERCRTCDGQPMGFPAGTEDCPTCGGHGSLKAAALDALRDARIGREGHFDRCEDCGHPVSDGTWVDPQGAPGWGRPDPVEHAAYLAAVELWLREGEPDPRWAWVHYSACDEGCRRHGGPGRVELEAGRWREVDDFGRTADGRLLYVVNGQAVEASWRTVDVRFVNGWPHDLRPENLRLLCLRCYAGRRT